MPDGLYHYQPAREITISTTGNIDALDLDGAGLVRMTNASLTTIRGIAGGFHGRCVTFVHTNAEVDFAHQDSNPSAANRLINALTSAVTPISTGGAATYQYDGTTARWRLVNHHQGTPVAFTCTWAATAGTAPSLGDGTIDATYYLWGTLVRVGLLFTAGGTTTFGDAGQWTFSMPIALAVNDAVGHAFGYNTGVANYPALSTFVSATAVSPVDTNTTAPFTFALPFVWATGDQVLITIEYRGA